MYLKHTCPTEADKGDTLPLMLALIQSANALSMLFTAVFPQFLDLLEACLTHPMCTGRKATQVHGKKYVLDTLHSGMSHDALGHEFKISKLI